MRGLLFDLLFARKAAFRLLLPRTCNVLAGALCLVIVAGDEADQLFIAHFFAGTVGRYGVFILCRIGQEFHKLLLYLASSGDVYFIYIRHQRGYFLKILLFQRYFMVVRRVLVTVIVRSAVVNSSQNGEVIVFRVFFTNDGGMMGIHPNAEGFPVFM